VWCEGEGEGDCVYMGLLSAELRRMPARRGDCWLLLKRCDTPQARWLCRANQDALWRASA
jgi:hypothetical protein